ncbi:MAG TPA: hypothetical protein VJG30_01860 [Candidatus Nanoarchaeia archaeon]|nr:hypothetical protein [Candidatus Nanoarchaeia archaeon]
MRLENRIITAILAIGFTVYPVDKGLFRSCFNLQENYPVTASFDFRKAEEGNKTYFRKADENYTDMIIVRSRIGTLTHEVTLRRDKDYIKHKEDFDRGDYLFSR